MEYLVINNGFFTTSGEEMFAGDAGRNWAQWYPALPDGRCKWSMRSLFLILGDRRVLIDTGPGNKLSPDIKATYGMEDLQHPAELLRLSGLDPTSVTDVVLTQLHFDHCGGTTLFSDDGKLVPAFPGAVHHISRKQWDYAHNPELHDRESYVQEDFTILREHKLNLADHEGELFRDLSVRFYDGHTPGQMIPFIKWEGSVLVFAADLLPSSAHIRPGFIMSYDLFPDQSIREKEQFVSEAADQAYQIVLQHDLNHEMGSVVRVGSGFQFVSRHRR
jgi:glyoxylase-like metal-dependent hydrolase (beta-lactamase superfamily II)